MTDPISPEPTPPARPRRRRVARPTTTPEVANRPTTTPEVATPAPAAAVAAPAPDQLGAPRSPAPEPSANQVVGPRPEVASVAAPPASEPPGPSPARSTGRLDGVAVNVLEFERGSIGGVRAGEVTARLAAIGGIAAGSASVELGMVSGVAAREATVRQGMVRGVLAQRAHVEQSLVRSVTASTIETGPGTGIMVAFARQIDGQAKILVDWRGALAFGVAFGLISAAARLARRR